VRWSAGDLSCGSQINNVNDDGINFELALDFVMPRGYAGLVTDKDRYGSSLGKKWDEKVRPILCAADAEALQAPEVAARYIHAAVREQIKPKVLREIRRSLQGQRGFFDGGDTRRGLERELTGTVAGEQLLECMVRAAQTGATYSEMVHDLAGRAIATTRARLKTQRNLKDDAEGQAAFEQHAAATHTAVHRMLMRDGGEKAPKGPDLPKASTADLLNFVVWRAK
jgi:hypothetical protein